jgi:hypothetical protein
MHHLSPSSESTVVNLLPLHRRARPLLAVLFAGVLAVGLPIAGAARATASTVDWVDGADTQHCLQDDRGAALTQLAEDKWCQPIPSCHEYDGNNPKYKGRIVHDSASNGIWQGAADEVLYADNLPSDYNLTEPSPRPTATPAPVRTPTPVATRAPGRTPTPVATRAPGGTPTPAPRATPAPGDPTSPPSTPDRNPSWTPADPDADDLGIDPDEQIAEGAPSAPGTPTLTVDGSTIVVTWAPSADVDLDGVTGYVVQISGGNRAEVDAATTTSTFTDLPDGFYRGAVRAVNDIGESAASTPSEPVTVGTPVASFVGTLTWAGDVAAGADVTLTGTGYAPNADLDVELHSDPVWLTTVTTDGDGAFSAEVTVPQDTPEGDHHFVVAHQGTLVSESPVTVAAAAPAVDAAVDAAGAEQATPKDAAETVPPFTGLVILSALAVAGVLLLVLHYARGGSPRRAARRAGASAAGVPAAVATAPIVATAPTTAPVVANAPAGAAPSAHAAATAVLPPLPYGNPLITAFAPAGVGAAPPARSTVGVHRTPEATQPVR